MKSKKSNFTDLLMIVEKPQVKSHIVHNSLRCSVFTTGTTKDLSHLCSVCDEGKGLLIPQHQLLTSAWLFGNLC